MTHFGYEQCEVCRQPATIHKTAIVSDGSVVTRHYCESHGTTARQVAMPVNEDGKDAALATLRTWYAGLTDSERRRLEEDYRMIRRVH